MIFVTHVQSWKSNSASVWQKIARLGQDIMGKGDSVAVFLTNNRKKKQREKHALKRKCAGEKKVGWEVTRQQQTHKRWLFMKHSPSQRYQTKTALLLSLLFLRCFCRWTLGQESLVGSSVSVFERVRRADRERSPSPSSTSWSWMTSQNMKLMWVNRPDGGHWKSCTKVHIRFRVVDWLSSTKAFHSGRRGQFKHQETC